MCQWGKDKLLKKIWISSSSKCFTLSANSLAWHGLVWSTYLAVNDCRSVSSGQFTSYSTSRLRFEGEEIFHWRACSPSWSQVMAFGKDTLAHRKLQVFWRSWNHRYYIPRIEVENIVGIWYLHVHDETIYVCPFGGSFGWEEDLECLKRNFPPPPMQAIEYQDSLQRM